VALNQAFLNRSYPSPSTYLIEREKIQEFATAIKDTNPISHDLEFAKQNGYADLVAPPTFLISIQMSAMEVALFDPELGLDYSKVVHGEQSFEYLRPVLAGDELSFISIIEDIKSKVGNDFITIRSEVKDKNNDLVAILKATLIARGTAV